MFEDLLDEAYKDLQRAMAELEDDQQASMAFIIAAMNSIIAYLHSKSIE